MVIHPRAALATFRRCFFASVFFALTLGRMSAQTADATTDDGPSNLGHSLKEMVRWRNASGTAQLAAPAARAAALLEHIKKEHPRAQVDAAGRVVADVILDGTVPLPAVRRQLAALGIEILGEQPANGRSGTAFGRLSVWLPVEFAPKAAAVPGVQSVTMVRRPWKRVGKVTSQGVGVLHADAVQTMGYTGKGIAVGVVSDSYDLTTPHAALDVAADDLPGPGNPAGRTTAVRVIADGTGSGNTDEGRGMLQIVHDVAPDATLAFATAGVSQTTFATAIRNLRTDSLARCDIITDDIIFPDEPFFSDGVVAQAVDDVVTSNSLSGKKVLYYSAAGNGGGPGLDCQWVGVSDADARGGRAGTNNLKLATVPAALTSGGFLNFAAATGQAGTAIAQKITLSGDGAEFNFQWNDPFIPGRITTDYNVLVFDTAGNYLSSLSGIDNNFSTGEAIEFVDLNLSFLGADTSYQLAITRAGTGGAADRLRYIIDTNGNISGTYLQFNVPSIFGHSGARNSEAIAANDYANPAGPEDFSAYGPVTNYFDASGNRLGTPEVRQQPVYAAPDGVDTSFFPAGAGNDTDNDGFPNFYGTSAAAPHAAGVAALLLQAGGGPGSVNAAAMRALLESTANNHDLDPSAANASATAPDSSVAALSAFGDASNASAISPTFFTFTFMSGRENYSIIRLTIDLGPAGLQFDPAVSMGFPFTIAYTNGFDATGVTTSLEGTNNVLNVFFPAGVLLPGGVISFGIDRDTTAGNGGNNADLLDGATFTFQTVTGSTGTGTFRNKIGAGYSLNEGFGLINAQAALTKLLNPVAHPTFFTGEAALANGVYYLAFPNGNVFGYYSYQFFPYLYHFDLGFEYFIDANDGKGGAYLYDFASNGFFYTSPSFPFPYLYDFNLGTTLYYYPNASNPGHYTTAPRYFFNFKTGQIITK